MTYEEWRTKNPKYAQPYQETEEQIWNIAQQELLESLKSRMIGRVVNGKLMGTLIEEDLYENNNTNDN